LDTSVLQRQFSLISEQQESVLLTVILEMYKRISNMLSASLYNAILGLKCLHTCNHFIFCLRSRGSAGEGKGERDLWHHRTVWDLGE